MDFFILKLFSFLADNEISYIEIKKGEDKIYEKETNFNHNNFCITNSRDNNRCSTNSVYNNK